MSLLTTVKEKLETSKGLYAILGVRKNASLKSIKAAFKEKAKIHHPDHGGEEKAFTEILTAYRTLRDPEKRKIYDETGEIEDSLNNDYAEMVKGLVMLFESALNSGIGERANVDLIQAMQVALTRNIDETTEAEIQINKELKNLINLQERIKRKSEGENLFTNILKGKINNKKKTLKSSRHKIKILSMAGKELEEYDCITEIVDIVRYYSVFSPETTTA